MPDFQDNNWFICPKCEHGWEDDPHNNEYSTSPSIYCPNCGTEIRDTRAEQDMWYVQDSEQFAADFLKFRGFTGLRPEMNTSWRCLALYIERFLVGNRKEEQVWTSPEFHNAYLIVKEYSGKPVIDKEEP